MVITNPRRQGRTSTCLKVLVACKLPSWTLILSRPIGLGLVFKSSECRTACRVPQFKRCGAQRNLVAPLNSFCQITWCRPPILALHNWFGRTPKSVRLGLAPACHSVPLCFFGLPLVSRSFDSTSLACFMLRVKFDRSPLSLGIMGCFC